ncbi:hypothetical protein D9M68_380660 [compost metagenome]
MSTKNTTPAKQEMFSVTLLQEHIHAGKKEPKGAKIEVTAIERQWLIEQQIVAATDVKAE